jgi:hypothetical protein
MALAGAIIGVLGTLAVVLGVPLLVRTLL